jgi:hypothetical protein
VKGGSSCGPGQSCLPTLVGAAAHPPDICVPNCDSQQRCPPNHFCFRKLSGSGSPPICLPGLLGFLCESDVDCIVGKCVSDNEPDAALELKLCTVPCSHEDECEIYDSDQGKFVCQPDGNGAAAARRPTHIVARVATTTPTARATRDQLRVLEQADAAPTRGPAAGCAPDAGPCTPRGGFGHVCLPFTVARDGTSKPGCYPATSASPAPPTINASAI